MGPNRCPGKGKRRTQTVQEQFGICVLPSHLTSQAVDTGHTLVFSLVWWIGLYSSTIWFPGDGM